MQVYVIGDVGIEEELKLKGINYMGGPSDADQKVELSAGYALPHDPDVSAPASHVQEGLDMSAFVSRCLLQRSQLC